MTCSLQWRCPHIPSKGLRTKKRKKLALQCQDVEDKALAILQQERSVQLLNVKKLAMLLAWNQAPKVSGAKKADKLVQWQNIVASKKSTSFVCSLDK